MKDNPFDDPVMRRLGKLDIFLVIMLVTTVFAYYQIKDLYNTPHDITIHVSLAIGTIFAGLILLSFRTYNTKKELNKRQ